MQYGTTRIAATQNGCYIIYVVVCILLSANAKGYEPSGNNYTEYCRFKGNMCDVDTACLKALRENFRLEDCDENTRLQFKSAYKNQSMSFEPTIYDKWKMPENFTYSVFTSDVGWSDELRLVSGCCNLDSRTNDTCWMPATFNQSVKFFVVFPYRNLGEHRSLYCRMLVPYADVPVDFCVEGEEVVDPCLEVAENGIFKVKYRYTPLSGDTKSKEIKTNRCCFPLPAGIMPKDKAYPIRGFTENMDGFIVMKPPNSAIVRNVTEHHCTSHENISSSEHLDIATNIYNERGGDFVCCGIKQIHNDSKYYSKTYCTNMQVDMQSVLPFILPISAFAALLALIAGVKCCQARSKLQNVTEDWKTAISLRSLIGQYEEQPDIGCTVGEVPKCEEFSEVVPDVENDSSNTNETTPTSMMSESLEEEYGGNNQDEFIPHEPTDGGGGCILEHTCWSEGNTSDLADDTGFEASEEFVQELGSESPTPNSPRDRGYLAKTLTTDASNQCGDSQPGRNHR